MSAPATAPGVEIVATKLHAPDVNKGFVPRDLLVVRLAAGVSGRLVLVCAPAGWGKTVLLAQWRRAERGHRPFAWVSLDPADDDPVRFWSYVVAAVRTVVPGFGGGVLATLPNTGPALNAVVLPRLINELAALPEPIVLVLDDYHELRDELVHARRRDRVARVRAGRRAHSRTASPRSSAHSSSRRAPRATGSPKRSANAS